MTKNNKKIFVIILICVCVITLTNFIVLLVGCKGNKQEDAKEITLSQTSIDIVLGEDFQLTAINSGDDFVAWSSEDDSVASVSKGLVVGKGLGKTNIVAKVGDIELVCEVKVGNSITPSYSLQLNTYDVTIYRGDIYYIDAYIKCGGEQTKPQFLQWEIAESEDSSVIEINQDGKITGKKVGKTTVNVYTTINDIVLYQQCEVKVINKIDVNIANNATEFKTNSPAYDLGVSAYYADNHDRKIDLSSLRFRVDGKTANSTSNDIISISNKGVLTFRGGSGKTFYTVSYGEDVFIKREITVYEGISNISQFNDMANNPNGYYVLENDIDFSDGYTPIPIFNGELKGDGYTLKNISLAPSGSDIYTAMFYKLNGVIKDLRISNATLNGIYGGMLGNSGVVAQSFSGLLENVYVQARVYGVTALKTAWADYRTWGMSSSGVFASSNNGTIKNSIINVVLDKDTDVCVVSNNGVVTLDNVFVVNNGGEIGTYQLKDDNSLIIDSPSEVYKFIENSDDISMKDWRTYNITFSYPTGETKESITNKFGKLFVDDKSVQREGFDDCVWMYNGELFDVNTIILEDINLVAKWKKHINNPSDFMSICGDNYYMLKSDLDFSAVEYTQIPSFSGILEGNGYSIKNIMLNSVDVAWGCQGLFGDLSGTVQNLAIENIKMSKTDKEMVGTSGFIAYRLSGTVNNIYLQGSIDYPCKTADRAYKTESGGVICSRLDNGLITNIFVYVNCVGNLTDNKNGMGIITGDGQGEYGNYFYAYDGDKPNTIYPTNGWNPKLTRVVGSICLENTFSKAIELSQSYLSDDVWDISYDDGIVAMNKGFIE